MIKAVKQALFKPLAQQVREIPLSAVEGVTHTAKSTTTRAVAALGMTSAILVTLDESGDPDSPRYRVLDGSRRVRDAIAAGLTHIPAVIAQGDTRDLLAASLTANLCRSSNVADNAATLRRLAREAGGLNDDTLKAIAKESGIGVQVLRKTAKLLTLPDELIQEIGGRLSPTVAEEMAALPEQIREQAVAGALEKLGGDPKARFTGDDLKAAKAAKTEVLGSLLGSAFAAAGTPAAPAPLPFATPREIAAAKAAQTAKANGVSLEELIAELNQIAAKEGQA